MDFLRNFINSILNAISNLLKPFFNNVSIGEREDVRRDSQEKLEALIEATRAKDKRIEELEKEILRKDIIIKEKNENIDKSKKSNSRGYDPKAEVKESMVTDKEEIRGTWEKMEESAMPEEENQKFTVETVLFGTNRSHSEKKSKLKFGSENDTLKLGKCEVSIPRVHEIGKIERPFLGIKFLENINKHIVIQEVKLMETSDFEDLLCSQIASDPKKKALLFIHGYNSTFEAAARRTAQIKSDMKFEGAAMFYSWPSSGREDKYIKDGEMTLLSESHLQNFILSVLNCSEVERLYVIGHSMGTRPLCNVLKNIISIKPKYKDIIKEVILTAPDINAQIFINEIVPAFQKHKKIITLYASSTDLALKTSHKINGFRRAGESGNNSIIMNGVETIDSTNVDTDLTDIVKHSYFGKSRSVLNDMVNLIIDDKRPDDRFDLMDVKDHRGEYWVFRK